MRQYLLKRLGWAFVTLWVISIVSFVIIQLPPGDYLTSYVAKLRMQGDRIDRAEIEALREQYGLDKPIYVQYFKWISGILLHGDFGYSLIWQRPVKDLIWERLMLTAVLAFSTMLFTWALAIPIGVYSATHQYSLGDYLATFISFLGKGVPGFMLALALMWIAYSWFGTTVGGLFSPEYRVLPWSLAKVWDMLKHLWIPMVIAGTTGTASLIRYLRANLLDELHKPYVVAARARGLPESRLLWKYPVRVALNPFISTVGWTLPKMVSGGMIVAIVLSLPTTGPLLLDALLSQDMYLAGSFILLISVLTVIGTFISDVLLAWSDPRIRYE